MQHRVLTPARVLICLVALAAPQGALASAGDQALDVLPSDVAGVIGLDMTRIRQSGLYKSFFEGPTANPGLKQGLAKLKTEFGIDPNTNLEAVVIGLAGNDQRNLVVLEGSFDQKKVLGAAKAQGSTLVEKKGKTGTWHEIDGQGGVAFSGKKLLLGSKAVVEEALAVGAKKKKGVKRDGTLKKMMGSLSRKSDAWFALWISDEMRKTYQGPPQWKDLKGARGTVDLSEGLALDITVDAGKKDAAAKIKQELDAQVKRAASEPLFVQLGFAAPLQRMTLKQKGNVVRIAVSVTGPELARLQALIGLMAAQGGGGMGGPMMMPGGGMPPPGAAPGGPVQLAPPPAQQAPATGKP